MGAALGLVVIGWEDIVVLLVALVVFLVARELVTWYWKINRIVQLLESIDRKLGGGPPTA